MVSLAWAMGKPLALLFDPFESLVSLLFPRARNDLHEITQVLYISGTHRHSTVE